jgi:hypothetical protein
MLRHFFVTALIQSGVTAKVAQTLAGHHSAAVTLDQYADAVPQQREEAGETVATVLLAAASGSNLVAAEEKPARRTSKLVRLARPERFELPTSWFVARRSIQLSYGRAVSSPGTGNPAGARILPYRRITASFAATLVPQSPHRSAAKGHALVRRRLPDSLEASAQIPIPDEQHDHGADNRHDDSGRMEGCAWRRFTEQASNESADNGTRDAQDAGH